MGLFEKIAHKAISDAAKVVAEQNKKSETLEHKSKRKASKFELYQKEMIEQSLFYNYMWMKETTEYLGDGESKSTYTFFDMGGIKRYEAEGRSDKKLQQIKLYDSFGYLIGDIKENLFAFRIPLFKEDKPVDFEIFLRGENLGKLKSAHGFIKDKLVFEHNNWTVQRKKMLTYNVSDHKNKEIAVFSSKVFKFGEFTFIDYENKIDEPLILMMALAIRAQDKSEDRKEK